MPALRQPQSPPQQPESYALGEADTGLLEALKARCALFGVDATTQELLSAGLLLLQQQTETALEVAILQSLRADRSFKQRKARRR